MEQTLEDGQGISKPSEISFKFNRSLCLHGKELSEQKGHGQLGLGRQKWTGKEWRDLIREPWKPSTQESEHSGITEATRIPVGWKLGPVTTALFAGPVFAPTGWVDQVEGI